MYQEALRSPVILRARALQEVGILPYAHQHPLQFGEPITDQFETPMCVKYMGVRSLRKEFAEWSKVAASYDSDLSKGVPKILGDAEIAVFGFGVALVSAGMYESLPSPLGQSFAIKSILAGTTVAPIIIACRSLASHWDKVNQRKKDIISYEIAKGNADICQQELARRGRAVCSHNIELLRVWG